MIEDEYDEYDEQEAEPISRSARSMPPLSSNPIVAAVQSAMTGLHFVTKSPDVKGETPDAWLDKIFGVELERRLGRMVLRALVDGDKKFALIVAKAVKGIDPTFNRHFEKEIADAVKDYVWKLETKLQREGKPLPDSPTLKALVERDCNKGKPFFPHQWPRLAKMLHKELRPGRPRNPDTKPSRS